MTDPNTTDLTETLRLHKLWRQGNPTGIRANLREANLRGADLEGATLPDGMVWWQGGAYGPRRRMIRVLSVGGTITVIAGCLAGTRDHIENNLAGRVSTWAGEIGQDAADLALANALALIEMGCQQVTA